MLSDCADVMNIRFENRKEYLYAFFAGKRENLQDTIQFWQCAIDECNKRAFKKLLIEQDLPNPLSTLDIFQLMDAILKMPISHLKVAFVDRDVEQIEMNIFGETVAVNRGGVGRVFTSLSEAEAWLIS
jgi:hypothetical protein